MVLQWFRFKSIGALLQCFNPHTYLSYSSHTPLTHPPHTQPSNTPLTHPLTHNTIEVNISTITSSYQPTYSHTFLTPSTHTYTHHSYSPTHTSITHTQPTHAHPPSTHTHPTPTHQSHTHIPHTPHTHPTYLLNVLFHTVLVKVEVNKCIITPVYQPNASLVQLTEFKLICDVTCELQNLTPALVPD